MKNNANTKCIKIKNRNNERQCMHAGYKMLVECEIGGLNENEKD
jgi:hypothetical protein